MRRALILAGAALVVALAGPAYVLWATWNTLKLYEQGDIE